MAEKQFEAEDPMELVGTRIEYPPGTDADAVIGRALVEEYALIGTTPDGIWRLFEDSEYQGTHDIYARRGPDFCRDLIVEVFGPDAAKRLTRRRIPVRPAHGGGSLDG
ncbi:MAG: hypothetical protein IT198_14320 [Acidimicrobiia bacterium]|nr:hypothetical protein [Acidimicrobiia bacterium]